MTQPSYTDFFVDSGGVRLAVRDYGGTGQPLIFIHGGPGPTLSSWNTFARRMSSQFRAIAYDQRGHGQSDDADDYSYEALTGDVRAIVEEMDVADAIIVGHSWGGWIALTYAARYHDCVGVVAVDGPIVGGIEQHTEDDWVRMEAELRSEPYSRLSDFVGTSSELDDLRTWFQTVSPNYDREISDLRRSFVLGSDGLYRSRITVEGFMALNRAVDSEGTPPLDTYDQIRCPVLLVLATDSPFRREAVEDVLERYPKVAHEWLECGHVVQQEKSDELAGLVTDFAATLAS